MFVKIIILIAQRIAMSLINRAKFDCCKSSLVAYEEKLVLPKYVVY